MLLLGQSFYLSKPTSYSDQELYNTLLSVHNILIKCGATHNKLRPKTALPIAIGKSVNKCPLLSTDTNLLFSSTFASLRASNFQTDFPQLESQLSNAEVKSYNTDCLNRGKNKQNKVVFAPLNNWCRTKDNLDYIYCSSCFLGSWRRRVFLEHDALNSGVQ